MHVKEILNRQPPQILYHYTNQTGLLGIIKSQEIWASHTQYLNDQREFRYAVEMAREVLDQLSHSQVRAGYRPIIHEMEAGLTGIEAINVCVCSFSEAGDVLSQWRAYGGGAGGFSIGFAGSFLRAIVEREQFWLVPCVYDEGEQRALIEKLLEDVLNENVARLQADPGGHRSQPPGGNLVAYLNRYVLPLVEN